MFDLIEKLRGKSERTKKLVAAGVAFIFAGIILLFWIFSVMPNFAEQQEITARVQSATPSPLSTISQIISQGTSGIGNEISKIKSVSSGFFGATQIVNNASSSATNTNQTIATTTFATTTDTQ